MIQILAGLSIPESEISFTFSRSGGPGGQNVNKVSSKVTLEFDLNASNALSDAQRERIRTRLSTRINKDGILRVISQRTRSQELNRADALERFILFLQAALRVDRTRVKTRVPQAVREQRITSKKKRTITKRLRSKKNLDSE